MNSIKFKNFGIILVVFLFFKIDTIAQVGIGTTNPNANAMLDIDVSSLSAKKGLMPPRMTTVQKNTLGGLLGTTDKGMLVFDTDLTAFYYWNGTIWLLIRIDSVITDSDSLGNIYYTGGATQTDVDAVEARKIQGSTQEINLVNFSTGGQHNRLVYTGASTTLFSIICSLSFNGMGNARNDVYSFYIAKGSPTLTTAILPSTMVNRFVVKDSDVGALSISGTVELSNGEWIEVWAKIDDPTNPDHLNVNTYNLLIQSVK